MKEIPSPNIQAVGLEIINQKGKKINELVIKTPGLTPNQINRELGLPPSNPRKRILKMAKLNPDEKNSIIFISGKNFPITAQGQTNYYAFHKTFFTKENPPEITRKNIITAIKERRKEIPRYKQRTKK